MKIYINKAGESWVVDRFRNEWFKNSEYKTRFIDKSDIVWIIAPWMWKNLQKKKLINKKVVCTIHHIDLEKFDRKQQKDFYLRDKLVDEYHAPSLSSSEQLKNFTDKKINSIPFWVDSKKYFEISNKNNLRKKYGIPEDKFVVGSFQRDTEGEDLITPKLSKGPDKFIKFINEMTIDNQNIFVLLSGYRRQYIIQQLESLNINYKYIKKTSISVLNELYNILDLYIVASRVEGGPQSIMECSLIKVPIISTKVGLAEEILNKKSIIDDDINSALADVDHARKQVEDYIIPKGIAKFEEMFKRIYEN